MTQTGLMDKGTGWLNGYKNKIHTYAVSRRPTSDLGTHVDSVRMKKGFSYKWK